MASSVSNPAAEPLTYRRDAWWVGPLVTALLLGIFVVYSTYRAVANEQYDFGSHARAPNIVENDASHSHLLSPFYSPNLLGFYKDWLPPWLIPWASPAFLILWAPAGFRVTCYYYRKAYYRAFFGDPRGCAVKESRKDYKGETRLFLFQNLHRFFLYVALLFLIVLWADVVISCMFPVEGGGFRFGLCMGTFVLGLNTTLLSLYTFSCHSWRHLVGGNVDCFSCVKFGRQRYKAWKRVSLLNTKHMWFAWTSLIMVGLADFYVWMVASGRIPDIRFF